MNVTKLFIVDDHYMVIEGIRSLLQNQKGIEWMGHSMNAESCLAFLRQRQPDVILMDINLPDKNGIELCREVRERWPGVFVIGLSTFNQLSLIQNMINNGASGYVLKNATERELMEGIETVMNGKMYLSLEAARVLSKNNSEETPVITSREKEVLEQIAEGLTNNEIAAKLFISTTTVDTHRKNLLTKLSAKNTAELIKLAFYHKIISIEN
jgi:DNA-binding NarL/FixJ family response regulator